MLIIHKFQHFLYMSFLNKLFGKKSLDQLVQQQERFFFRKTNANSNGGIAVIFR